MARKQMTSKSTRQKVQTTALARPRAAVKKTVKKTAAKTTAPKKAGATAPATQRRSKPAPAATPRAPQPAGKGGIKRQAKPPAKASTTPKTSSRPGAKPAPVHTPPIRREGPPPRVHADHPHRHGPGCGHVAILHDGHVDYVHDGHLHHNAGAVVTEHLIEVSSTNPDGCRPLPNDPSGHVHGAGCGHERVPHGDHIDYIVNGRLHHPHGDHNDDHGPVEIVKN